MRSLSLLALVLFACEPYAQGPSTPLPPECNAYAAALQACSTAAKTLDESVACENFWRSRCGRPPRKLSPLQPDKDGGR